jgi:hypothetical protein
MWRKPGIIRGLAGRERDRIAGRFEVDAGCVRKTRQTGRKRFTGNYALACFDPAEPQDAVAPMTMSVANTAKDSRRLGRLLPMWVGVAVYVLLIVAGNRLLNDPDTMWQVTVGQWILDHRAVPRSDIYSFTMNGQPWISTQWLAQVIYAKAYAVAGWSGPVVVAATAITLSFVLMAQFLVRRVSESATLVFIAAAFALTAPHLLARPHALAMPVMVMWIGGLIAAADRREAPSFWLLLWLALWANLHGGFVFGVMMVAPIALDAVVGAEASQRKPLAVRWAVFGLAALVASCCTPCGWDALLASKKILSLGAALPLISEWRPADFGKLGAFELYLLLGAGLALYRGVTLPPTRIMLLLGLVHMALSQSRAADNLAIVAPLILAGPLASQIGGAETFASRQSRRDTLLAGVIVLLAAGTLVFASMHRFAPHMRASPVAAVTELKKLDVTRVFNDYDFGGYLIHAGVPTFIDGRTELYGEKFFIDHNAANGLIEPENLFRLLDEYNIEATLMRTQSAATKLLDHVDGWQKIYSDDIATIHLRKAGAVHTREPAVDPKAK